MQPAQKWYLPRDLLFQPSPDAEPVASGQESAERDVMVQPLLWGMLCQPGSVQQLRHSGACTMLQRGPEAGPQSALPASQEPHLGGLQGS